MSIKSINGVPLEWARMKILVVTHDDASTWTATTPAFPGLRGTGKHQDIAAADLLTHVASFALETGSDVQGTIKRAKKAEAQRKRAR